MINELSATGPVGRLGFRAVDGTAEIRLLGKRFDFSFVSTNPEGSDLGAFSEFCMQAKNILAVSLNFFQTKGAQACCCARGFSSKMSSQGNRQPRLKTF